MSTLAQRYDQIALCERLSNESHAITRKILATMDVPPGQVNRAEMDRLVDQRAEVDKRWGAAVRELVAMGVVQ